MLLRIIRGSLVSVEQIEEASGALIVFFNDEMIRNGTKANIQTKQR